MTLANLSGDWETAVDKARSAFSAATKGGADHDEAVRQAVAAAHNFMQANGHDDAEYADRLESLTSKLP